MNSALPVRRAIPDIPADKVSLVGVPSGAILESAIPRGTVQHGEASGGGRDVTGMGGGSGRAVTAAYKTSRPKYVQDEFFGQQPSSTASLPDPTPLIENLTRCVIEILSGARELEQISRWVTDDVYRHLLKRVVLSARARHAKGRPVIRPSFMIGSTTQCEPRDGVVEAVVIVRGRARTRAVAIRLEGLDQRWRATAINVL